MLIETDKDSNQKTEFIFQKDETGNIIKLIPKQSNVTFNRYVIGESPLELLNDAVKLEYDTGIRPLVGKFKKGTGNIKHTSMERYGCLMVIHAVNESGKGKMELCLDQSQSDLMFSTPEHPDKYMGIQVKTTTGITERLKNNNISYSWRFSDTNKNYSGLLMYMRSLTDGESWLIPFNILNMHYKGQNTNIAKSNKRTKIDWSLYKVNDKNLAYMINEYYRLSLDGKSSIILKPRENISIPITINNQKEQDVRKKILPILLQTGLTITEPILENMRYDFTLGKMRIQEKICSLKGVTGYRVSLYSGDKHLPYNKDDFDILLVDLPVPYEHLFYLIPMDKLVEHGVMKTENCNGRAEMHVYPEEIVKDTQIRSKNNWSVEFLCSQEDPNLVKRMLTIYDKQLHHKSDPIIIENPTFWDIKCKTMNDLSKKWNLPITYVISDLPYNFIIFNKRILEKHVNESRDRFILYFKYQKDGKPIIRSRGDFDFIYSRMPERYNSFYLIPSFELERRDMLQSETSEGKGSMCIPFPGMETEKNTNAWINSYIFSYDDPNIKEKLTKFLIF